MWSWIKRLFPEQKVHLSDDKLAQILSLTIEKYKHTAIDDGYIIDDHLVRKAYRSLLERLPYSHRQLGLHSSVVHKAIEDSILENMEKRASA